MTDTRRKVSYPMPTEVSDRFRARCDAVKPKKAKKEDVVTGLFILCGEYFPDKVYQFLANAGESLVGRKMAMPAFEDIGRAIQSVFDERFPEPAESPPVPARTKSKKKKKDAE